jgi:cytochrome c oxidase subunit II
VSSSDVWPGTFWLPEVVSPATSYQDALFYFIYWLSVFFFVLVVGLMCWFAWKYRKTKTNIKPTDIHGSTILEVFWSAIPAVLFVWIFAWGLYDWIKLGVPPQDSIEVRVTAMKWDWLFTDVKTGAETNDLIVPVNTAVRLVMSSRDVIHGFYVPDFRINRDVLPSQYTVVWFKAEKKGVYPVFCSQYCGTKHSQMTRFVRVVSQEEYEKAMLQAQGAGLTLVQLGERVFKGKGACMSCHDISTEKKRMVGPPLFGVYGRTEEVLTRDGKKETVAVDDNYLRESLLDPNAKIVVTYGGVMPTYKGVLSDKEVEALLEYMKSLK